jgi:DNA modification methylase
LAAEEAELDENLRRKDLTWQEHAAAVEKLHKLRTAQKALQAQVDVSLGQVPQRAQTVADTTLELKGKSDGAYQDAVRKEILVAKHLDNPLISKAKSADEAFKILKREETRQTNVALAVSVGKTFTADKHLLLNVSCLDFMALEGNWGKYDVILTDPPYGMDAQNFNNAGGKMEGITHSYDDTYAAWVPLMKEWTRLSFLVASPQAHAYVFCDIDRFHELKQMMQDAGWYVFRTPLINHKLNSGRVPWPDCGPRRQYELVLYAIKGKKPVTHIYSDVLSSNSDEQMSHGAQKPVAVYQNLLQRSVKPGDKVLDCFAGSGTIFPACHSYQCEATGLELNPEYYGLCLRRLQDLKNSDSGDLLAGLMT